MSLIQSLSIFALSLGMIAALPADALPVDTVVPVDAPAAPAVDSPAIVPAPVPVSAPAPIPAGVAKVVHRKSPDGSYTTETVYQGTLTSEQLAQLTAGIQAESNRLAQEIRESTMRSVNFGLNSAYSSLKQANDIVAASVPNNFFYSSTFPFGHSSLFNNYNLNARPFLNYNNIPNQFYNLQPNPIVQQYTPDYNYVNNPYTGSIFSNMNLNMHPIGYNPAGAYGGYGGLGGYGGHGGYGSHGGLGGFGSYNGYPQQTPYYGYSPYRRY